MQYSTFGGRTGLRVSQLALGTANFGTRWGPESGAVFDDASIIFDTFVNAGGTFIDTADTYQSGESESILADLIKVDRDQFVLASKFTLGDHPGAGVTRTGNSRKAMVRALEASLRRLNTDYLDLYWVHWPDFVTPVDEIIETVDVLVRAGKILHAGFSNFPAWRSAYAAALTAERGNSTQFIGVQTEYSLVERSADRDILPMAEALRLGVALYSPLGGGLLTGKYRSSDQGRLTSLGSVIHREDTDQKTAAIDAVLAIATALGVSPGQVAMAWELEHARRAQTTVIPIVGPRTPAQIADYLSALDVTLEDQHYQTLTDISSPALGAPHEDAANNADGIRGGVATQFALDRPVP
jgi:aryl-alcohol dehydrogenase-like predicted oxidoreductase